MDVSTTNYTIPQLELPLGDLWVFGYGSIMWRPGFVYDERRAGMVYGYHLSLCVWSCHHRGYPDSPGLVLGLDLGGSCNGIIYKVRKADKYDVADYLYRRELVTDGYEALLHRVHLKDDGVTALCFRANRRHPQYAGRLEHSLAAQVVRRSVGQSGANPEYLASAVNQLSAMGINDKALTQINNLVQII